MKDKDEWAAIISVILGLLVGFAIDPAYTIPVMVGSFLIIFLSSSEKK